MNPVIVLDIAYGGYGVVKALHHIGAPIYAFHELHTECSESKTKLCKIIRYDSSSLRSQLINFAQLSPKPPVLFLTSDKHVKFIDQNRDLLNLFLIDFPNRLSISLAGKDAFYQNASQLGLKIAQVYKSLDIVAFPCIVKPACNNPKWWQITPLKGIICNDQNELNVTLHAFREIDLTIQEWIPGPTTNIHFTMVYYKNGKCQVEVTGQKVREWPIVAGTGCCLTKVANPIVSEQTRSFFDQISYEGFGSLEFKQHEVTKEWYAIEPTIGRVDLNSEFTMLANVNFPTFSYSTLTGIQFDDITKHTTKKYWVHEFMDIQSSIQLFKQKNATLKEILTTYLNGQFHLFNIHDMLPFMHLFKGKVLKSK